MNRLLKPAALCCAVAALAGCAVSPIPVSENFQYTTQKKVRSAGHWNILSQDVVEQMVASLEKSGVPRNSALRVPTPADASPFDLAFHEFLVTGLVQKGWYVLTPTNNAVAALTLDYQTQIIKHNSPRPHYVPGLFTMLGTGIFVLHDAAPGAAALGLAVAMDVASSIDSGGPTPTELVLTTTISGSGRYISRKTDVYYVEQPDTSLFANLYSNPATLHARTMKVVAE